MWSNLLVKDVPTNISKSNLSAGAPNLVLVHLASINVPELSLTRIRILLSQLLLLDRMELLLKQLLTQGQTVLKGRLSLMDADRGDT
jgi:hypothetical protein